MLFNSIDFIIFLPIVFTLYWVLRDRLKVQNLLIVIASYVFYGWWDWRFLSLIIFSTLVDYFIGLKLKSELRPSVRKYLLWTSIIVNLGLLGFFKYYNFFIENFISSFTFFGASIQSNTLNIILPVGISFYTFQTLSYTIDVYRRQLKPTSDFLSFAAFVSFFPQLVAGPIERASNLLPQFFQSRKFDAQKAVDGLRQILWGLFKKMVIADNAAVLSNHIFNQSENYSGATLWLGAIMFTFQIYGDFSGYSDIAIGTSRLFGFDLKRNFAFPYFSRDMAEFWRRWHISLSTWFRDYLYIPLGGSKGGIGMKLRNTFLIFLVSGFWHGANWTFIVWGLLNAIYFLPLMLRNKNRHYMGVVAKGRVFPSVKEFSSIISTFLLAVIAWVVFRAENINHAYHYLVNMFSGLIHPSSFTDTLDLLTHKFDDSIIILILFFIVIEWMGREREYAIEKMAFRLPRIMRWGFYAFLVFLIGMFMQTEETPFIYFQF